MSTPLITNDAVIFGLLMTILGFVFITSSSESKFWKKFYNVIPALLMCYFLPSLLSTFGIIDSHESKLYFVASRYLLPTSLVLLTISVDLKEIIKLGPKALIMFFTATIGIVLGGPIAIMIFSYVAPEWVHAPAPNELWRGMSTIAGSWIGGGANQAAMKEVFEVQGELFSKMVAVDIIVANVWMAVLLTGIGFNKKIDSKLKADASAIEELKNKMTEFQNRTAKIPTLKDLIVIGMVGFMSTGLAHFVSDLVAPYIAENYPGLERYSLTSGFFWIVVIATAMGVILSFTKAKELEGAGASKVGSVFIYILVATIGTHMDIGAIFEDWHLFLIGLTWMAIHVLLLVIVAKIIRAPYFFLAVGSKANIGGAASAPVVAAAFHPALAPVGVLLAVLGYVLGTYGAWISGVLMEMATP